MENFRRAIGLRIKENKEVYEGEVTELTPVVRNLKLDSSLNLLIFLNFFLETVHL